MRRNEYMSLEDITLMVERGKYAGEFEIGIMDTGIWFDADAWILLDNGFIDIDFELPSCIDMVEHDEFAHMCISAILEEYPEHVRGFDRFVNSGFEYYEEAIEELKSVNGGSFVDTYTKYNNRVASNIKASGDAGRLTYEGISRRCKGRRINESVMSANNSILRKDKALLEGLAKKYGKNYILNEISNDFLYKDDISHKDNMLIKRLINAIKSNRFDWERYSTIHTWNGLEIQTQRLVCSYGIIGYEVYIYNDSGNIATIRYDWEKDDLFIEWHN